VRVGLAAVERRYGQEHGLAPRLRSATGSSRCDDTRCAVLTEKGRRKPVSR